MLLEYKNKRKHENVNITEKAIANSVNTKSTSV